MRQFKSTVSCEGPIFSPFSGQPADGDAGCNESDPTLQWVHYGDAASTAHLGMVLRKAMGLSDDADETEVPAEVIVEAIGRAGGMVLEVDTGWNGVNWYGFIPSRSHP